MQDEILKGIKSELKDIKGILSGGSLNFSPSTGFLIASSKDSTKDIVDAISKQSEVIKKRLPSQVVPKKPSSKKADIPERDTKGKFIKKDESEGDKVTFFRKLSSLFFKNKDLSAKESAKNIAEGFGDVYYQSLKEIGQLFSPLKKVFSFFKKKEPTKAVTSRVSREDKKRLKLDRDRNKLLRGFGLKSLLAILKSPLVLLAGAIKGLSGLVGIIKSIAVMLGLKKSAEGLMPDIDMPDKKTTNKGKKGFFGKAWDFTKKIAKGGVGLVSEIGKKGFKVAKTVAKGAVGLVKTVGTKGFDIAKTVVKGVASASKLGLGTMGALLMPTSFGDEDMLSNTVPTDKLQKPSAKSKEEWMRILDGQKAEKVEPSASPVSKGIDKIKNVEAQKKIVSNNKTNSMTDAIATAVGNKQETIVIQPNNDDIVNAIVTMDKNFRDAVSKMPKTSAPATYHFEPSSISTKEVQ